MRLQENKQRLILLGEKVTDVWLADKITACIQQIEKNSQRFGTQFPSACATNGKYRLKGNDDWTNGFWTGMLWLAYEWTKEKSFLSRAMENIDSFQTRLDDHFVLDHHDIGFLYSLSAVAGYKITGDEHCKQEVIQAADVLLARFQEKGEFIQAWGAYGDPQEYRLIIDSLLNLPLLFAATQLSGEPRYAEAASKHYQRVRKTVIKNDATTFHTYYFDPETGQPSHGATHQGNSDQSIWARGQSWAILGLPLNESYLHSQPFPENYPQIVEVFLAHLPADLVPYWDFDFNDQHPAEKDSSALAIAACGLLEAEKMGAYPDAKKIAKGMLYQLGEQYAASQVPENEGLLLHGVYAHAEGKGIDEPNLWGDYFYLEALIRLALPNWRRYW
ncbi:glycoside hydrolase family 88 protein [Enterococcus casseliflavus]|uniref:glycoside hydrolase family 88 protein n=1 Tax=Enterococcus casseliflavus TaxID=37734 RepID=UPI000EAE0C71|nr:glycoside hydrolase family 88 protein [Enterococcus casseliflavus]AYJ44087.1 glucuronyl hydrolase [Enterococcus casseliflavus]MBS5813296.1 glycoside hydrolase family 88 protein [Enterococcus casseliflavus]MBX9114957.1 glucuronyl hydrolase [Enterococcus casseliflavus]MBX9125526.1 glucuronyl hydrolase [Enterococcus casseliflavus]MDU3373639.1 glycoside hydrolase family 88 protein [Enterococcus casseliflavus]